MSLLRKKILILVLACLILPVSVRAIEIKNPLEYGTFEELIYAIINFIFTIALVLAPLFIIIGGFYFVTATDEPARIETGKRIILYTLIGLLVILLAKGIITLIKEVFGVVE